MRNGNFRENLSVGFIATTFVKLSGSDTCMEYNFLIPMLTGKIFCGSNQFSSFPLALVIRINSHLAELNYLFIFRLQHHTSVDCMLRCSNEDQVVFLTFQGFVK